MENGTGYGQTKSVNHYLFRFAEVHEGINIAVTGHTSTSADIINSQKDEIGDHPNQCVPKMKETSRLVCDEDI